MDHRQSYRDVVGQERQPYDLLSVCDDVWWFVFHITTVVLLVGIALWIADDLRTGLAQFIAGIKGFEARDTLVTVVNTMWGSFWLAIGILYAFTVSLIASILYGMC